jgi:hypothetical protein
MPTISFEDIVLNRPHVREFMEAYRALGILAADLLLDEEVPADWGITAQDGLDEIEAKASLSAMGNAFVGQHHAAVLAECGFTNGFFDRLWCRLGGECTGFVWWADFGRRRRRAPH